jgi:glycosyltransferase involved in cell wall biosynthesis
LRDDRPSLSNEETNRLKVTQVSIGRFHHFHLARQMESFGLLDRIWTGYPRFKLRDETGIPPGKISTFPWLHTLSMKWPQVPIVGESKQAQRELAWLAHDTLDRRVAWSLREPRILVALSGQGEHSGKRAKATGGWHICDRGSSHIRYQDRLLREEYSRWNIRYSGVDPRMISKEEAEYDGADLITVPSAFVERSFVEMGVPAEKLRRIPYGGRLERFRPCGEPASDAFNILFVGHVSLRKGIPYLLEAFSRFKHPRKQLRIVGDIDPSITPVLSKFSNEGVVYVGTVANMNLAKMYSEAHVLVLPSIEEGLAMVMAEAMACGCPVIASLNTGAEDLFESGREGFIVPVRSSDSILRALEQLADDEQLARDLRSRATSKIEALEGWNKYGREWRDLIETLCVGRIH